MGELNLCSEPGGVDKMCFDIQREFLARNPLQVKQHLLQS